MLLLCCVATTPRFYLQINTAISKRAKLESCQQSESASFGPVAVENDLLCPVPMSKAILKLNHSYDSTISVDSIFTHCQY